MEYHHIFNFLYRWNGDQDSGILCLSPVDQMAWKVLNGLCKENRWFSDIWSHLDRSERESFWFSIQYAVSQSIVSLEDTRKEITIVAVNEPTEEHLNYVAKKMAIAGPPEIRCIWSENAEVWFAIEGSHRLAAAKNLGMTPIIVDITGQGATTQREGYDRCMDAEELHDWVTSDWGPEYTFREQKK